MNLLPLLLGPLKVRPIALFEQSDNSGVKEDQGFMLGLNQALDMDLLQGGLTQEQLDEVLMVCATFFVAPRVQPLSDPSPEWPSHQEPWVEPENVDLRERLLARLVHAGANPWQTVPRHLDKYAGTTFGTLASHGYLSVANQCLNLPSAADQSMDQKGPARGFGEYGNKGLSLLEEVVWQNDAFLVDAFLKQGAQVGHALRFAQTPQMVRTLLDQGAVIKEDNFDVSQYWLKHRTSRLARELMQAIESEVPVHERWLRAIEGKAWGPVQDALDAYPNWETATLKVGDAQLGLVPWMLCSIEKKEFHTLTHAIKMMERAGKPKGEVAPGLSEAVVARMALQALIYLPGTRYTTKGEKSLNANLHKALVWLNDGQAYEGDVAISDAKTLAAHGEAFQATREGARLGFAGVMAHIPRVSEGLIPNGGKVWSTWEDAKILGPLCRLQLAGGFRSDINPQDTALFKALMGQTAHEFFNCSVFPSGRAPLNWVRRFLGSRPDADRGELLDHVTSILSVLASYRPTTTPKQDVFYEPCSIIRELTEKCGATSSFSLPERELFLKYARTEHSPFLRALYDRWKIDYEHDLMQAATVVAPARPKARL